MAVSHVHLVVHLHSPVLQLQLLLSCESKHPVRREYQDATHTSVQVQEALPQWAASTGTWMVCGT